MPRLASPRIDPARVYEARAAAGLSQEALARRMGCSTGAVASYERGKRNPGDAMLARLAVATGKPAEWFLSDGTDGVTGEAA